MLCEYVSELAKQMGINATEVTLEDGKRLGLNGTSLLKIMSYEHKIAELVFQYEIDMLDNGIVPPRLNVRMKAVLSHLQLLLEH